MMRKLDRAGWNGDQIAGWIAAQRRDGILSITTPEWLVESQIEVWSGMGLQAVRVKCRLEEAALQVKRALNGKEEE